MVSRRLPRLKNRSTSQHGFLALGFLSIGACRDSIGLPRRFPPLLQCGNSFALPVDGVSYPHPKSAGMLFGL
ncbi:hypothetical protein RHMOL_Rhmol08G0195700 [Rhododendron molle]|uniref:Uncharacterized protein n=1 Tax=Rhododendron molle TaxID=49168 RepID=A0ACC0MQ75_RHOML|nr:hypothetical protein RHMOL_Rhmol08G0195700 [Rhododendron molle]